MDSSQAILLMIRACVIFIILTTLSTPIKFALKVALQGAVGLLATYLLNILFMPIGVSVGLNILTWLITGILGIPGLILLYALSSTLGL